MAEGVIELKEDDFHIVETMLYFMYTFDYDESRKDTGQVSPMLFHVQVYGTADKYGVMPLRSVAKVMFNKAVRTCWDMDDFARVIAEVYSSTPSTDRGLRDIVVEVAHEHIEALLKKVDFRVVLEETAGFAADVTQLMVQKIRSSTNTMYQCPSCKKQWQAVLSSQSRGHHCLQCGHYDIDWNDHSIG